MSEIKQTLQKAAIVLGAVGAAVWAFNKATQKKEEDLEEKSALSLPLPKIDTRSAPPLNLAALVNKQTLKDLDVDGKRVLMRVDYNVKIKKGEVVDPRRIEATLDSIRHILSQDGPKGGVKCIVLIAHLGRPAGNFDVKQYSLEPVAKCLSGYLPNTTVRFLPECVGPAVEEAINACAPRTVFVLENLRFHGEETGISLVQNGDKVEKVRCTFQQKVDFRAALSRLGDVFVFEAFGAAHRPHSSIIGIDAPQRVAGLDMEREMSTFARVFGEPKRPFLVIIGGAKVSDKILVIENMLNMVDEMIIGGGMAYTFKKIMQGMSIGSSLYDEEGAKLVPAILKKAKERGVRLHFPVDHITGDKFSADAKVGLADDAMGIPDGWMGLDIGPQSRTNFAEVMQRANTILWNGPVGVYEFGSFGAGTISLMWEMVKATKRGATCVIGGGDTGAASKHFYIGNRPVNQQISFVSTGGGSSLVLMEGKLLPGVDALSNKGDYSRPPKPDESKEPVDDDDD